MSDLSAPLAALVPAANLPPAARANSAPVGTGEAAGTSFQSVLKEKAEKPAALDTPAGKSERKADTAQGGKDAQAAEPARERSEAADESRRPAASEESTAQARRADGEGEGEGAEADAGSATAAEALAQITALMMQLPASANEAASAAVEDAAAAIAGTQGALVRELARGHGRGDKNEAGNRGLALGADKAALADSTTGTTAGNVSGVAGATGTEPVLTDVTALPEPPTPTGATSTAAISADDPALTAETTPLAEADKRDFSQLLQRAGEAQAQKAAEGTAGSAATARSEGSVALRTPVGHPNWSNELGDKVVWLVNQQRQQADLVLNPPQLGRIEVSLTVSGDQASAVFASPNAAVREMLENSLPRLREILAGSGLNLGQADVGAQSFGQQQAQHDATPGQRAAPPARDEFVPGLELASTRVSQRPGARVGMVDTFV